MPAVNDISAEKKHGVHQGILRADPTETCGCGSVHYLQSVCGHKERK